MTTPLIFNYIIKSVKKGQQTVFATLFSGIGFFKSCFATKEVIQNTWGFCLLSSFVYCISVRVLVLFCAVIVLPLLLK